MMLSKCISGSLCILEVLLLTIHCQTCICNDLFISPHDLSMELNDIGHFNIHLSETPVDDVLIRLTVDHSDILAISESEILFNNITWESNVTVKGINPGKVVVTVNSTGLNLSLSEAFVRVNVKVHHYIDVISEVFGWIYFCCWTSTLIPQIILNFIRKSVIGLNMDYIVLNLLGTSAYTIYNFGVYFSPRVKEEYFKEHPFGILSIRPQDVALSILQFTMTAVCALQGLYFNFKDVKLSKICLGLFSAGVLFLVISVILAGVDVINWLTCLYYFSYLKLGITTIKYIPQVYLNYRRKSTTGWSVGFPILDFTGGSMSISQMFLMAFNYDDWNSIMGNPSKLLLGIVSMLFDACFITQHFMYRKSDNSKILSDDNHETKL